MTARAIGYFLARNGTFVGCILLTIFFYYWNSNFLSLLNLRNIGEALSALGVVSIPLALLMIGGAVDLSVGSVASLSGVVAATCMINAGSVALGIIAGLIVGLTSGLINGLLVSYYRFNSIVITLGALSVWGGLALNLTGGRTVIGLPESFTGLALIKPAGIPLDVFVLLATILYGVIALEILPYGRRLRAAARFTCRIAHKARRDTRNNNTRSALTSLVSPTLLSKLVRVHHTGSFSGSPSQESRSAYHGSRGKELVWKH